MVNNGVSVSDLRVFCEAAHYRNFSRTAKMLGVSPAHVTKRIQALETELDVKLFQRSTRYVGLTEPGEHVHTLALEILERFDGLHGQVATMKNEPRGELRVSTSLGFGRRVVSDALAAFSLKYPAISIKLEVMDRLVDLARDRFDLDVRIGDIIDPNYIARRLATNYRILCASPNYLAQHGEPVKFKELTHHNCLIVRERDHPVGLWKLDVGQETVTVKVNGSLTTNNGEIAVIWALAGHGIMLRSVWDAQRYLETGQLVHILPAYRQEANVWAVYPERLSSSAKIDACVMHLENYFRQWEAQRLSVSS